MYKKPQPQDYHARTLEVISDPTNALIARDCEAGQIIDGTLRMHNGIKVLPNSYYENFGSNLITNNRGVHEPQEEWLFSQVLRFLPDNAVMLELGSYWAYYSIWFAKEHPQGQTYLVECEKSLLEIGKKNLDLNDVKAKAWIHARVAKGEWEVDSFMKDHSVEHIHLLHSDIQGSEIDMLEGAQQALKDQAIDFLVISTHSNPIHYTCEAFLQAFNYRILDSVNFDEETFCYDGILLAASPKVKCKIAPCVKRPRTNMNKELYLHKIPFLAQIHQRMGQPQQAAHFLKTALKINPNFDLAIQLLAQLESKELSPR